MPLLPGQDPFAASHASSMSDGAPPALRHLPLSSSSPSSPSPPPSSQHFLGLGNTTSSATFHAAPRPTHRRPTGPITSTRGLAPVAGYSEDWLDQNIVNARRSQTPYAPTGLIEFWAPLVHSDDRAREAARHADSDRSMPPHSRPSSQSARPEFVDLTAHIASSPPRRLDEHDPAKRHGEASERETDAETSAKRRRTLPTDTEEAEGGHDGGAPVEETLRRNQQQEAIRAQQLDDETGPMRIGRRSCIICMEPYTNVTVTACGHVYCHECLIQALMAGEKTTERGVGNCPVCRKPLSRKTRALNVIPISFMKKSTFKTSRRGIDAGEPH